MHFSSGLFASREPSLQAQTPYAPTCLSSVFARGRRTVGFRVRLRYVRTVLDTQGSTRGLLWTLGEGASARSHRLLTSLEGLLHQPCAEGFGCGCFVLQEVTKGREDLPTTWRQRHRPGSRRPSWMLTFGRVVPCEPGLVPGHQHPPSGARHVSQQGPPV